MRVLIAAALAMACKDRSEAADPTCPALFGADDGAFVRVDHDGPLTFRERDGVFVGETIAVALPEDIVSVAITVDGGDVPTAVFEATLDDELVLAMDERPDPAWQSRLAPGEGWDSQDTWYPESWWGDSAWDSTWDSAYWVARSGWWVAPFYHGPDLAGTLQLPITRGTAPRGGCLRVSGAADATGENGDTLPARVSIVGRRGAPADVVDVHLVIAQGTEISDAELDAVVERMFVVWGDGGALRRGEVTRFDVTLPDGPFVRTEGPDISALRLTQTAPTPGAVRLFLVQDFINGRGTLGMAAGIPGPFAVADTLASGVVASVDSHRRGDGTLDVSTLGETMAHEVGHQLGLFHTTESNGVSFDPIADTPECQLVRFDRNGDGQVSAGECRDLDGDNFMFWTAGGRNLDQGVVTADQAWVMKQTPITR